MAKFLKFIVNTIMIVAIVVAASLLIPPFAGVTTLIVDDIEMETNLEIGSVTYAWGVDAGELKVGDKVLLQEEGEMLYSVSSVEENEFVLEDTLSTDGEMVTRELQGIVNKVVLTVPVLGYVSMALRTVEGLIIVGLSVVFVIILFILAEVWRKEEEDDWDEDEDSEDEDSKEEESEEESEKESEEDASDKAESDGKELDESEEKNAKELTGNIVVANSEKKEEEPKVALHEGSSDEKDLFDETSHSFAANIANMMGLENQQISEADVKKTEKEICKPLESTFSKDSKVLAMPSYTKEELLERAKAAGDEPELVMDELSGVTFLDYSDVL